jgi:hypothetical protein
MNSRLLCLALSLGLFSTAGYAQGGSARASMERCVDRVLDRLAGYSSFRPSPPTQLCSVRLPGAPD